VLFHPPLTDLSYTTRMFRIFFARCLATLMLLLSVQNAVGEVDEVLHHDIGAEHTLSVDVPNTDACTYRQADSRPANPAPKRLNHFPSFSAFVTSSD